MMNGYFISITNNLLEDKHFERMGNAVWLYMWLIDKMTEISEGQGIVNHGNPITYSMVKNNFSSMSLRTYRRWIFELHEAEYINTGRAKHGLYITINKAKKQFGKQAQSSSAKNGTPKKLRGAKKRTLDVPKMATSSAKNGTRLYIDNNTITNTSNNTTNVVGVDTPLDKRKPEINELFEYWEITVGYPIKSKVKLNRNAANNLLKTHGADALKRMINGVALAHEDRYAPSVADFTELQANMNRFLAWGRKRQVQSKDEEIMSI